MGLEISTLRIMSKLAPAFPQMNLEQKGLHLGNAELLCFGKPVSSLVAFEVGPMNAIR